MVSLPWFELQTEKKLLFVTQTKRRKILSKTMMYSVPFEARDCLRLLKTYWRNFFTMIYFVRHFSEKRFNGFLRINEEHILFKPMKESLNKLI